MTCHIDGVHRNSACRQVLHLDEQLEAPALRASSARGPSLKPAICLLYEHKLLSATRVLVRVIPAGTAIRVWYPEIRKFSEQPSVHMQ